MRFVSKSLHRLQILAWMMGALAQSTTGAGADGNAAEGQRWADFVEPGFPYFSSVLDARRLGPGWPADNLTPRGLILNLGHECWACFDTDLLRISAIWTGPVVAPVTPVSMSQGSYHRAGIKAPEGQTSLPEINGTPWLANALHPGWQTEDGFSPTDPRPPAPDPKEVGRGAIPPELGRFSAVRIIEGGVLLEYEVRGFPVVERITAKRFNGNPVVQRSFKLARVPESLILALGRRPPTANPSIEWTISQGAQVERARLPDGLMAVRIKSSSGPVSFQVAFSLGSPPGTWDIPGPAGPPPPPRWPEILKTRAALSESAEACVVDDIPLPTRNPWRRNLRLADLAFTPDGHAFVVTFDGDVWRIDGLKEPVAEVGWRRFASGFHEPLGIALRDGELFVNDRNGIWKLRDTDDNGEADLHELFSNAFAQTAETREFATGFRAAPDGSFVIAKGGQQSTTLGKHNGTVLRVARDGRSCSTLGWGLRMPFIGVHPRTGLVTASDQQGHYIPATPLHIIQQNQFYGFISLLLPKEQYPAPIADPVTWIPHPVNASGASQVWLTGARMGPFNDAMIHIGYFRPELFLVRWNERARRPQASVLSLTRQLAFAPLNGAVNPADGQLYVTGMQIWGTIAKEISGLARLRYTGAPSTFPREIVPMDKGILVRFEQPLDARHATNTAAFSVERWNYRRTANYGSPHFKLDGSKGQETLTPSSAYLSKDSRSVFIGIPEMRPVMQMRLGWSLASPDGRPFASSAYFTPHELIPFAPAAEGFDTLTVDLHVRTVRSAPARAPAPPTAAEGRRVAELMGCVACHSDDGSTIGKVGPTWKGIFKSKRDIAGLGKIVADEAYLRESIKDPTAKVVRGFEKGDVGMPSYEGVITDSQIEALILHLKTLR